MSITKASPVGLLRKERRVPLSVFERNTAFSIQCLAEKPAQNPGGNGPGEIRVSWVQTLTYHSIEEAARDAGPIANLGGTSHARHHGQLDRGIAQG